MMISAKIDWSMHIYDKIINLDNKLENANIALWKYISPGYYHINNVFLLVKFLY